MGIPRIEGDTVVGMELAASARLGSVLFGGWVASAAYVQFRGRERLAFMRQLADHSTLVAPYNTFIYLTSAVPNTPMLRSDDFPELATLCDHWTIIRDEAVALLASGTITKPTAHNDLAFESFYKRDWRRFYLKWCGDYLPSARPIASSSASTRYDSPCCG